MSLKSELANLKRLAAKVDDGPAGYLRRHNDLLAKTDAWQKRFIEQGLEAAGPMPPPFSPDTPLANHAVYLKGGACASARFHGVIGRTAYLPGMDHNDRRYADAQCGVFWQMVKDLDWVEGLDPKPVPHPWPEWERFAGLRADPLVQPEGPDEDLTQLSDTELDDRIAAAERILGEPVAYRVFVAAGEMIIGTYAWAALPGEYPSREAALAAAAAHDDPRGRYRVCRVSECPMGRDRPDVDKTRR